MAHFAELGINNVVCRVVVVKNEILLNEQNVEEESRGSDFCRSLFGGTWVQTSYNGSIRKNFACRGHTYDSKLDAFIPPKPFDSWILNEDTCVWEAPVSYPEDGNTYIWNEDIQQWEIVNE